MPRLLEDDALRLLGEAGLDVPPFETVAQAEDARAAAERLGGRTVIKALIPAGGRGKVGAVKLAGTPDEAHDIAAGLLGKTVLNYPVTEVLVGAPVEIAREIFASIAFDSETKRPVLLLSAEGGVDIETILEQHPDTLLSVPLSLLDGFSEKDAASAAAKAGLSGKAADNVARALSQLWTVFAAREAEMVEINPLVLRPDDTVSVPTAVINLDEQAMARPLTELEWEMRAIDATDPGSSIRFNEFPDGDIAILVSGGGTGMSALDGVYAAGGRPACTMDITPGRIEEKTYLATKAVLQRPNVKALFAGSPFINFIPVDIKVRGTMKALRELGIDPKIFPIVFRFDGPNIDEAKALAAELPGIVFFDAATPMEDAAEAAVRLAYEGIRP
jgi:succinyl-CoA synthetase beta subunit